MDKIIMNQEAARQFIRNDLDNFLQARGINTSKPFRCLNPEHEDNNPSMSLDTNRLKAHCFSCGADYDTFDLIALEYNLIGKDLFNKAYELYGIQIDENQNQPKSEQNTHTHIGIHTDSISNLEQYFKKCSKRVGLTNYLQVRGLTDPTIKSFNLGYDPQFKADTGTWKAVIIPTGYDSFTARNIDASATSGNRYRKSGKNRIFNDRALLSDMPIFIVEGEIDALSIIEAGGEALALGSTANYRQFLEVIALNKPKQPLLLMLDNDSSGSEAADKIIKGLDKKQIPYKKVGFKGYKDANEALRADRQAFIDFVNEWEEKGSQEEPQADASNARFLASFLNGISESVDTQYTPTEFRKLDHTLEGGLYEGLYIVGAVTSIGKTTFILQIADQIAQQGHDVLFFSLEMARSELIAKSISRHTAIIGQKGGNIKTAKTTRGITTRSLYDKYSQVEKDAIQQAIKDYHTYAGNIYMYEAVGGIGAEWIRNTIRDHIAATGKKPIVMIDYIQILAPSNPRATDKQNMDKNIIELKRISRDYKLPLIGVSSFNRAAYDSKAKLDAFKESGAIEYSSDILMTLQIKGAGDPSIDIEKAKQQNPRTIELVILKNRNGKTGDTIEYRYYPMYNYFMEA